MYLFSLFSSSISHMLTSENENLSSIIVLYFMIYAESSIADSHLIQSNLQTSLDKLTVFNSDHRIILSCTKSVRVLFERQKSKKLKPQDVSYNGQVIPASTSVKFLGITLTLLLPSYFTIILSPISPVIASRKWILSSLQPMALLLLPSSISINPTSFLFDYGAPATCVASPHVQRIWEGVQTHYVDNHTHNERTHTGSLNTPLELIRN